MDDEDAFWAAKQVAGFTDEEIRGIVQTGEYSDSRTADWIADCLIQRRDKIAAAWLGKVLPLDKFRVTDGELAFDDLSKYGSGVPLGYQIQWATFDNRRSVATNLPAALGRKLPTVDSGTEYLAATIACRKTADGACPNPVIVYLRRSGTDFEVVGSER
jgi:hypothetical protein